MPTNGKPKNAVRDSKTPLAPSPDATAAYQVQYNDMMKKPKLTADEREKAERLWRSSFPGRPMSDAVAEKIRSKK